MTEITFSSFFKISSRKVARQFLDYSESKSNIQKSTRKKALNNDIGSLKMKIATSLDHGLPKVLLIKKIGYIILI